MKEKAVFILLILALNTGAYAQDYALDFDGVDDYVDMNASIISSTDNWTMMAWVKPRSFSATGGWRCVFYNGDDSGGYGFGFSGDKITGLFGVTAWHLTNQQVPGTDQWYHLAMRRSNGTVRFFLNGDTLNYSSTTAPLTPYANRATIGNMFSADHTTIYADSSFDGQIDEASLWSIALTDGEIREYMVQGLNGNETGLAAYYQMSDGSGTTLTDNSTNTNNGTLTNMVTTGGGSDWITSTVFNDSQADGNWNTTATWRLGRVPISSDNVRIGHAVTLDVNATVNTFAMDPSTTITLGSNTLTVAKTSDIDGTVTISTGTLDANGNFDATGGTLTFTGAAGLNLAGTVTSLGTMSSDNGTVTYDGTTQTVFSDTYNNLSVSGGTKTLGGDITLNGNLTINAGSTIEMSSYNVNIGGNLIIENGATWTKGSGITTFNASVSQTLTDNNSSPNNLGTVVVE